MPYMPPKKEESQPQMQLGEITITPPRNLLNIHTFKSGNLHIVNGELWVGDDRDLSPLIIYRDGSIGGTKIKELEKRIQDLEDKLSS